MSHVTNVIVAFGLTTKRDTGAVLKALNERIPGRSGSLVHLNSLDQRDRPAYGGHKALEVNLAIGAFNYLRLEDWVGALRSHEWAQYDCWFVQVMVQGQDNYGFASTHIWDDGEWNPGPEIANGTDGSD